MCDRLREEFGHDSVFIDVDALQPGDDFVDAIRERLNGCDLMVAVIGRRWTGATDSEGRRRLEQSGDYVRLEVETALERKIATFPVLVEGAAMPRPEELPIPLRPLARRQALELSDSRWAYDIARLITNIGRATAHRRPPWKSRRVRAAAVLVTCAGALWVWFGSTGVTPLDPPGTPIELPPVVRPSAALRSRDPMPARHEPPAPQNRDLHAEQTVKPPAPSRPSARDTIPLRRGGDPVAANAARVEDLESAARKYIGSGAVADALRTVVEGLKLDPAHPGLQQLSEELLRDAQARMRRAKAGAIDSGATIGTPSYSEALRSEAEAARHAGTGSREAVVAKYWAAEEQFRTAAEDARRELAAQKQRPEAPPPPDRHPAPETSAAPVATAGPVANVREEEPPRADAAAAQERAADEQRIRSTLQKYADAYRNLSVTDVRAVYPTAPSQLLSRFSQYRSYDMEILNPAITVDGTKATVVCIINARLTPKAGTTTSQRASTVFHLQKSGNSWHIVGRDVQ